SSPFSLTMQQIHINNDARLTNYRRALDRLADEFLAIGGGDNQLLINDVICVLAQKRQQRAAACRRPSTRLSVSSASLR
ncbi:MAG: hypothetical protein IJ636_08445, partial [Bacteroidales bacterium]|nr:hypothetical protein [Bacteroidales bacterium]